jgi:hypothetical protein
MQFVGTRCAGNNPRDPSTIQIMKKIRNWRGFTPNMSNIDHAGAMVSA